MLDATEALEAEARLADHMAHHETSRESGQIVENRIRRREVLLSLIRGGRMPDLWQSCCKVGTPRHTTTRRQHKIHLDQSVLSSRGRGRGIVVVVVVVRMWSAPNESVNAR